MTDMQIIQNFLEGVQESGKTTTAYDTTAEVIRVDENSVWVHIPGGVAETPVARTINAKKGDVVQVRVSGGTAFIVGNATAPPTDDATAIVAQGTADEAKETADVAKEVADAAAAQVQTVRNYFWHDAAGAHVSTVEGDATTGNNVLIDSDSMDIRNGETVLSSYSADGMVVYAKDSGNQIELAHLGYALGQSSSGTMQKAPYYSLGIRKANSIIGNYSVAEGYDTTASGYGSHAEGTSITTSHASFSHAEGSGTAIGTSSHAEGGLTTASGEGSHAEGYLTTASGYHSHAEGGETTASGYHSHAEGWKTTASNHFSHAEGNQATASGISSHAAGFNTIAGYTSQTVVGQCNDNQSDTLFEVGNGTADDARSNAFQVHSNGNVALGGALTDMSGNTLLTSAGQAVKAVGDKNGNDIATTYVKNAAVGVTDLNDAATIGFYSYSTGATNAPTTTAGGNVLVMYNGGNYVHQVAAPFNSQDLYVRSKSGGGWSAWKHVGDMTEVPTWTAPTFTQNRATLVGGGFYSIGKVVCVQMLIKMAIDVTSGTSINTSMIINNLPAPAISTTFAVTNRTSGVPISMMSTANEGGIRLSIIPSQYPLRQNDELIITGQYIKA